MEKLLNCKYCSGKPKLVMDRQGSYYRCSMCGRTAKSDTPPIYSPYSMGEGLLMARYRWNKQNAVDK